MIKIEEKFKLSYKDIERYIAILTIGTSTNDNNLVIKYGKKVIRIQEKSNSYAQSPFVEFAMYQAYIDKKDNNKALEIIKSLDKIALTPAQKARQKYLLGSVLDKLWRNNAAIKAYNESIKADPKSAWAKLAEDAKKI
jgi:tetratricopeptide (TPR) repeat protein